MPLKPAYPESSKEEPMAQPAPIAPTPEPLPIAEVKKEDDVKILWEKRKTPEELEEEAYRKRLASKPIEAAKLPEPIQSVPEPEPEAQKAPEPEPDDLEAESEASLPTTDPISLEKRVAELESALFALDTDLARTERLIATLSKYHPELFKKPVAASTTQEVAQKPTKTAGKPPKKEVPYVPLDPSVDGHILAQYDAMSGSLHKALTRKGR